MYHTYKNDSVHDVIFFTCMPLQKYNFLNMFHIKIKIYVSQHFNSQRPSTTSGT